MLHKRIYILNGHPAANSLNRSLAEAYAASAQEAGHDVRITHIHDLQFDMDYGFAGYAERKPLEPDLLRFQADVEWSEHFVMFAPMWWGGLPAKLKGLIDRSFIPGWAFDGRNSNALGMPMPLLSGRSARAIVTSDTPMFFFKLMYHKALLRQLAGQIFKFVGIKPTRITHLAPASKAAPKKVEQWLEGVKVMGQNGA